ncbi:MAG TPA: hypothetical protein ENK57_12210 [Polyangiaceae bacterium]|nr:hypothetical protein [Polyangiaceae bacterium]
MSQEIMIRVDSERVIEAAVEAILRRGRFGIDEDEFEYESEFNGHLQELVEKRISERVNRIVDELARERVEELVATQIDAVVAEGFPYFDRDGRSKGAEPFAVYVRKAIDAMFAKKSHYQASSASRIAEKAFDKHVSKAFEDEIKTVRKRVRSYVDEQLSGAVVKSLREAVGLRS